MGSQGKHDILSGQAATHEFDALLFDMDGTREDDRRIKLLALAKRKTILLPAEILV